MTRQPGEDAATRRPHDGPARTSSGARRWPACRPVTSDRTG